MTDPSEASVFTADEIFWMQKNEHQDTGTPPTSPARTDPHHLKGEDALSGEGSRGGGAMPWGNSPSILHTETSHHPMKE